MLLSALLILHYFIAFKHPFSMLVVGPSNSGKTTFVRNLLRERARLIDPKVDTVILYYEEYQRMYGQMLRAGILTKIIKGWPSYEQWKEEVSQYQNSISVFDDSYEASQLLAQIYSIGSHHLKAR